MKKLKMTAAESITFAEGCELYLENCRQRNLREGTINHYKQSYTQFYKYFGREMPIGELTETEFNKYVVYLRETLNNDVSINSYLRDLITTLHFLMNEGYLREYKMKSIKVDETHVETYTDDELKLLLRKPDVRKCRFSGWSKVRAITCFTTTTRAEESKLPVFTVTDTLSRSNGLSTAAMSSPSRSCSDTVMV